MAIAMTAFDPHFMILVGLPGTGKTSVRNRLIFENPSIGYMVASSDDYVEEEASRIGIAYDEAWQGSIKEAGKACSRAMHEAVEAKRSVIVDQTHTRIDSRQSRIARARSAKFGVRCIAVRPPGPGTDDYAVWQERLDSRPGKKIPDEKMREFEESFVMPTLDEGFDMIAEVDIFGRFLNMDAAVP